MVGIPFISVRKHIRWADEDAREDTSTLVLTSAGGQFVDLRVYLPTDASQPELPNGDSESLERLEWGFAGTAKSTAAQGDRPSHTVWSHWIDSKTTDNVQDEGDMWPMDNGDVLEKGAMPRPTTGEITSYEEVWRDLDVEQSVRVSGVWKVDSSTKGMVIRIGEWMEGITRDNVGVTVERWRLLGSTWERVMKMGQGNLPCVDLVHSKTTEGGHVQLDGLRWECVEDFKW